MWLKYWRINEVLSQNPIKIISALESYNDNTTISTLTNLAAKTNYKVEVSAKYLNGEESKSTWINVTTKNK